MRTQVAVGAVERLGKERNHCGPVAACTPDVDAALNAYHATAAEAPPAAAAPGGDIHGPALAEMHTDPHPPTAFAHAEWVRLRDRLFRAPAETNDGRAAVARLIAKKMNVIQADYAHRMETVGMKGRKVAENFAKGKGGSMHMYSKEENFYGGAGIVGAQVPLGVGLAFANKYNAGHEPPMNVAIAAYGDGAANQGQIWEVANMSKLWGLPTVLVCENNKYGMGTSIERTSKTPDLHTRGLAHGIEGISVDGMDVIAVKEAAEKALAHCRSGKGPLILEMKTYRYRGHSMSDPAKYRTKEEVQKVRREHDPIDTLAHKLLDAKIVTEDDLKAIDKEVKALANEAAEFAQQSPEPDLSELWTDVLVEA